MTYIIHPVKNYNNLARQKYQRAIKESQHFPHIGWYLFFDEEGNEYEEGYVVENTTKDSKQYFKSREEAVNYAREN